MVANERIGPVNVLSLSTPGSADVDYVAFLGCVRMCNTCEVFTRSRNFIKGFDVIGICICESPRAGVCGDCRFTHTGN